MASLPDGVLLLFSRLIYELPWWKAVFKRASSKLLELVSFKIVHDSIRLVLFQKCYGEFELLVDEVVIGKNKKKSKKQRCPIRPFSSPKPLPERRGVLRFLAPSNGFNTVGTRVIQTPPNSPCT